MSMMYSNLRYLPTLAKLSTSSKNLKLNTDLGLKFPLVMKSCNIRMDRPFNVKHLFHWHQDIVYLLGSMNALTFWIPLTSVNKENGSVEIVPKSHTKGILPVDCLDQHKADQGGVMSPQDLRLRDEVQGDSIIIDANLGDLVVFSQKLLHRSTPNFNKKIRILKTNRTIGLAKNNLEFFRKEVHNFFEKDMWAIKKIEIFSEKLEKDKILNFKNDNNNLFYMLKNDKLYQVLNKKLSKNKFFKKKLIKKNSFYQDLLKKNNYDLIINCDSNNFLSKKFFTKKIVKDYENVAYTTVLKHKKVENNTASQVFTKNGPIAFLPISNNETSVVCSLDTKNKTYNDNEVLNLINKNNPKYQITKVAELNSFKLSSSNLRNYSHKNILAFGDILHRVHPLAGQGFNMTIRDLKILSQIIHDKIELGIQLDSLILNEFEKKTKDKNFVFSKAIGLIYEIFNLDKKIKNKQFSKILKNIGKNKNFNDFFIKLADSGLDY